uniref:polyribonucleotide nucleotidyltransferase n=1 Tax=Cacopsylla melanoneura TaxID=428564 RepID=A0A8D8M820_9HEMI
MNTMYCSIHRRHIMFSRHRLKLFKCFFSTVTSEEVSFDSLGKQLKLSTGQYAKLADSCVTAQLGDTSVMVTAVSKARSQSGTQSFLPLTVDYRQKAAAAGRIPTNFLRRELGASETEILASRLIDRSIRPLFPSSFTNDTQIMCNLLAVDGVHDPEVLAINASSAALAVSNIPWNGPVGAVRLGRINNDIIINPTRKQILESDLNLVVVSAPHNLVVMLEGSAHGILQPDFLHAIKTGSKQCQLVIQAIQSLQKKVGKPKLALASPQEQGEGSTTSNESASEENVFSKVKCLASMRVRQIFTDYTVDKLSRDDVINEIRADICDKLQSEHHYDDINNAFSKLCKEIFRALIFETDTRCDGRTLDQLRPISCEVDLHKPLHGSALFQRGQTQVLSTVALDSIQSALKLDPVAMMTSGVKEKNFFLHYEFPPYATREIGRAGSYGRREVGHGALAEKALRCVVPRDFPFTIRLTCEVLESNGSSSMASVCGGSLALMDAGVPISEPCAGVAVGLVTRPGGENEELDYRILTDLLGIEDYFGDMDFKLAGTKKGITAIQADVKIPGLPLKIVMEAVMAACQAKSDIINIMNQTLAKPRVNGAKSNWPIVQTLDIPPHKRGKLIGHGGMNMKKILLQTGVQITMGEDDHMQMFAPNQAAYDEARELIDTLLATSSEPQLEFGAIYTAKIIELKDIGVLVTLYPNMPPALLHNSQLDQKKIGHPSALGLEEGQEIQVKYFGRDPVSGLMRLSRKVLQGTTGAVKHLEPKEPSSTEQR